LVKFIKTSKKPAAQPCRLFLSAPVNNTGSLRNARQISDLREVTDITFPVFYDKDNASIANIWLKWAITANWLISLYLTGCRNVFKPG